MAAVSYLWWPASDPGGGVATASASPPRPAEGRRATVGEGGGREEDVLVARIIMTQKHTKQIILFFVTDKQINKQYKMADARFDDPTVTLSDCLD